MPQYIIDVTQDFSDWVRVNSSKFARPSKFLECGLKYPISGIMFGEALMDFTRVFRISPTTDDDLLAIECQKVIANRDGRRTWQRINRLTQKTNTESEKPKRERFTFAASKEFKTWFDGTRKDLNTVGVHPMTTKEFADALMSFVESLRYQGSNDWLGIACKYVVSKVVQRWQEG